MILFAEWLGISRTALYKSKHHFDSYSRLTQLVLAFVDAERIINKKIGGVKLHGSFCWDYPQVRVGRDRFLRILREHGRLLRRKRTYKKKGNPDYSGRQDLAHKLAVSGPGHLWVHDDTEVTTLDGKGHLALSTDAYSSYVVGYSWSRRANSSHVGCALQMGLADHVPGEVKLIHHSDNGSMYASKAYQMLLGDHIVASWSPPGRPDRNPKAQRINLTFKQEYLCDAHTKSFDQLAKDLPVYTRHYNERRPHMSCNNGYPAEVHALMYDPKKLWKQRPKSYPAESSQNKLSKNSDRP